MIGILKFRLPEEQQEFIEAQRGSEILGGLQKYDNYLRSKLKYEDLPVAVRDAIDDVRMHLHEFVPNIWSD